MAENIDALKACAVAAIDKASGALQDLSHAIWSKPELALEEHSAHAVLTDYLEKVGFDVERHYVLKTGFRATFGRGEEPHVAVLCEYDALTEIGHACGHNLIAEVGIAAGIGIKAAMESNERLLGKVTVLGTPAEEDIGGKLNMIDAGAFSGVSAALMAHPTPHTDIKATMLATTGIRVVYKGRASHASAFPWEGLNALDAAVMAYNNISCMRQQIKPTWRIHAVIDNGGEKPNIIPEETSSIYCIRAPTKGELGVLRGKVDACFQAAATATGCSVEIEPDGMCYDNMLHNQTLCELYETNARNLNMAFVYKSELADAAGSSDMGNVSHVVPGIHPMFYIGASALNHTRDFTAAAGDPKAQPYALDQGKALAMTAIDVFCNPELVPKMKNELKEDLIRDS